MHALATCFLALYLAHLMTDFVFQSDRMVARKQGGEVLGYAEHGGVHLLTALLLLSFALPESAQTLRFYGVTVSLTLIHLGIDWGKLRLVQSKRMQDGATIFLADQTLHAVTVCIAAWLMVEIPIRGMISSLGWFQSQAERTLLLLVVYVGVIFGAGYLLRFITKPLLKGDLHIAGQTTNELQNAGMYIGWLERFLVLTALLLQSPATVGLILTAKSIARYPELKSVRFAEYFLIGTLLSMSIGILGGLILLKAFYGTVMLSK
jgi:Protein of unknown function (DUF3307)